MVESYDYLLFMHFWSLSINISNTTHSCGEIYVSCMCVLYQLSAVKSTNNGLRSEQSNEICFIIYVKA